jgi:hypothetical protein
MLAAFWTSDPVIVTDGGGNRKGGFVIPAHQAPGRRARGGETSSDFFSLAALLARSHSLGGPPVFLQDRGTYLGQNSPARFLTCLLCCVLLEWER